MSRAPRSTPPELRFGGRFSSPRPGTGSETTQDPPRRTPPRTLRDEQDPESQPASDPPPGQGDDDGKEHDLAFDPDQIERDPAYNPPEPYKDYKGG
jgi:hypothetical protein